MSGNAIDMETSCGVVLVNFGSILLLQYPQVLGFSKGRIEEPMFQTWLLLLEN